jgi:hypothetical protein
MAKTLTTCTVQEFFELPEIIADNMRNSEQKQIILALA